MMTKYKINVDKLVDKKFLLDFLGKMLCDVQHVGKKW